MPVIRLDRVSLQLSRREEPVLRELDLAVPAGAFRWIVGSGGTGKTSLLRLLGLALRPGSGRLELFDVPVRRARRPVLARLRRRIGTVFQDGRLLPELSMIDNVALPSRLAGTPEARVRGEAAELLRWLGLGRRLDARADTLSAGEKRRTVLARAVLHRPALLLADDPAAAGDDGEAARTIELLADLNRLGSTVLVATSDETMVRLQPHPVLRLHRGRLSADG